jgi:hypothetical protein
MRKNPNPALLSLALFSCTLSIAGAFGAGSRRPLIGGGVALKMSSPGGWENDDFLESLGGEGGGDGGNDSYYGREVPENDLTDEEITMMAMRSAQFYNTDTSMEEAYSVPREGPPRKQEEEEEYEDFQ